MGLLFMCPIIVQPDIASVRLILSNLMQTFILTLQENIFDVHLLVDFPMTVDNMTAATLSHSASMTHSCMHHSTINFDPLHTANHAL